MPTHILTKITVILARVVLVKKWIGSFITPQFNSSVLTAPLSFNSCDINIKLTNCGTAIVITKNVRHILLSLMPFLFISSAKIIPKIWKLSVQNTPKNSFIQ